jgi:hypothetical protein
VRCLAGFAAEIRWHGRQHGARPLPTSTAPVGLRGNRIRRLVRLVLDGQRQPAGLGQRCAPLPRRASKRADDPGLARPQTAWQIAEPTRDAQASAGREQAP